MIFILAAGKQARWEGDGFKQLLPIGDTTILERTMSQLHSRGLSWLLVKTPLPYFTGWKNTSPHRGTCLHPVACRFTSETLLSTSGQWELRNIVLLGDVIYSHKTLDRILNCQEPIRWFGNPWEIFAISFGDVVDINDIFMRVITKLRQTIKQAELGAFQGKLRNFYHTYCNLPPRGNDTAHPYFEVVDHLTDYTNDVDSLEEYENFLKQHLVTMVHDDNNYKADG